MLLLSMIDKSSKLMLLMQYMANIFDLELLSLLQKILKHNCQELIQSVPFFENAPEVFITAVLTRLKFELFLPSEYIIRIGMKGDRMYFIQKGVVEVITDDNTVVTYLSEGAHFGEICLLTDDRRVASIKAKTMCDLFSLSKQNFQELLEEYPEMRPFFETIAKKRLNKIGRLPGEVDDESPVHGSACHIHGQYSKGSKCFPARSLSNALMQEAASLDKYSDDTQARVEKYKPLPSKRSSEASISKSPECSGDEEYAQGNPHFVSHRKKS